MKGWYRINQRAKWHLFASWKANNFLLVPACRREFFLKASDAKLLYSRVDLPTDAKLCAGCTASPDVRETA